MLEDSCCPKENTFSSLLGWKSATSETTTKRTKNVMFPKKNEAWYMARFCLVLLVWDTLQGTNISPKNGILKLIFLFPRWDMLIPWRVLHFTNIWDIFLLVTSPSHRRGLQLPPSDTAGNYLRCVDPAWKCLAETFASQQVGLTKNWKNSYGHLEGHSKHHFQGLC